MDEAEDGALHQLCKTCSRWEEIRDRVRLSKLIASAADKLETRWLDKDFKPTLGDYLKLLQLEREVAEEKVTEIKVTWVLPEE